MTRLRYVFPLRFRRFFEYSMNTTTKLFPALDAAHSRDMSHATGTLDARYTRHPKSSLKYFKILSIIPLIQTNMISCGQYVKHVIAGQDTNFSLTIYVIFASNDLDKI